MRVFGPILIGAVALFASTAAQAGWFDEGVTHLAGEVKKVAVPVIAAIVAAPQVIVETAAKTVENVVQVATHPADLIRNPIGTLSTLVNPILGGLIGGSPSLLQRITQRGNEIYQGWIGKPSCNAQHTLSQLSTKEEATLGEADKFLGFLTTPGKYMNLSGWEHTGCEAEGRGRPVRTAQRSTDKFWTIDVKLESLRIEGREAPPDRYLRLEVMPSRPAHDVVEARAPGPNDVIAFGGPVMVDHHGDRTHLEVHPIAVFRYADGAPRPEPEPQPPPPAPPSTPASGSPFQAKSDAVPFPKTHIVTLGENLSVIAFGYYLRQDWPRLYRANRMKVLDPDLIRPGQSLSIPPPRNERDPR